MKLPWFKRVGILYLPQNVAGWIIMLAAIGYAVYRFIDIDGRSHSASDTLRPFIINLFQIYIAYTLIAFLISYISRHKKNLQD
jgi:hypothetical protein